MISLLSISGSLRKASYNTALLKTVKEMIPEDVSFDIRTLHGIPLYDADTEVAYGVPDLVVELQKAIAEADAILIATPEYNNSIPGVLKNAIDWISRPSEKYKGVFVEKPVAILGASQGRFGTVLAQNAWLPVLRMLQASPWFGGRLAIPLAGNVFDRNGKMTDAIIKEVLKTYVADFIAYVKSIKAKTY